MNTAVTILDTLATLWLLKGAWNMTKSYPPIRAGFLEKHPERWMRRLIDATAVGLILGSTTLLLAAIWL